MSKIERVILIVLDGVGCGAMPDAKEYGDVGSNTLGNLARVETDMKLPNLERWGIGNITNLGDAAHPRKAHLCTAGFGKLAELSKGKDTTSGHWEMAGIVTQVPFATYPQGFPEWAIDEWVKSCDLPGVLGNKPASGTEIIKELGEEHLRTGKPILYTSADSVWQVAAHEEAFGLERLYEISKAARSIGDKLKLSRIIARPFVGKSSKDFSRTHRRKDFAQRPPVKTIMETLADRGVPTLGVGKISNIFAGQGIGSNIDTKDNSDGLKVLKSVLEKGEKGFIFVNLIDFDMLYGHRRDTVGFASSLEEFDAFIPTLESCLSESDLVLISADHGNDPTYRGTDHTREYVPLLVYRKGFPGQDLGIRSSFADLGQTISHALTGQPNLQTVGDSFFSLYESG